MSIVDRRKKLMGWFGIACRCAKCIEEAAVQEDSDSALIAQAPNLTC
jgi:hypothetical protein